MDGHFAPYRQSMTGAAVFKPDIDGNSVILASGGAKLATMLASIGTPKTPTITIVVFPAP
jgi:hypothetical protein